MLKKLFIVPYFGPLPEWFDKYQKHITHLEKYGYDFLFDFDLKGFSQRVESILGIACAVQPGTSLSHNYRTAFGLLYEEELKGYDYWGITDLDCVYGDPTHFVPDTLLSEYDIWSNHHNYICGPWTLFKNTKQVNTLFKNVSNWERFMEDKTAQPGRWTEVEYSEMVDWKAGEGKIERLYTHFQGKDPNIYQHLSFKDGILYDETDEIMTFHFNRHKLWPL